MTFRIVLLLLLSSLCAASNLAAQTLQTIADAKKQPLGTVVSVAGRVAVASEFGGPAYVQDATAGIAVFDSSFHWSATIGDSVEISGPLAEYQPTTNVPGTGLTQISSPAGASGSQSAVKWRVVAVPRVAPAPRVVAFGQIAESLEGQLLRLENATFQKTGTFQGNTNYVVADGAQTLQVRVGARTNLVGLKIPAGNQSVTGALSQFRGAYQLLPRFAADLGLQTSANPGDSVPKTQTFDATTWNVKWFGTPRDADGSALGPADSLLQFRNVARVLDSVDADLYGVEEVANVALFRKLADSLPRYGVVIAPFAQQQKTAFLFKKSVVDTLKTEMILTNTNFAAGRYPFVLEFDATLGGAKRRLTAIVIHAKAGTTDRDYAARTADAQALYDLANAAYATKNVLILGDFNDDLQTSIAGGLPSPYKPFVEDATRWTALTASLAAQGLTSYSGGTKLIDNIVANAAAASLAFRGAEKVENPYYVSSYASTTSDHYPVSARFRWDAVASARELSPQSDEALAVAPNPASDVAVCRFRLARAARASVVVSDALGREVWRQENLRLEAGNYALPLPASAFAPGAYVCRLVGDAGNAALVAHFVVAR